MKVMNMKFKCEICGKKFKREHGLKLHLERSKDELHVKAREAKLASELEINEIVEEAISTEIQIEVVAEETQVVSEAESQEIPVEEIPEQPEEILEESLVEESLETQSPIVTEVVEEPQVQPEIVQEYIPNVTDDELIKGEVTVIEENPISQQITEAEAQIEQVEDKKQPMKIESKLDPYTRLTSLGVIAPNLTAIKRKKPLRALNV